ncbi:hypothetical protein [Noviherbaspirillum malthae]|uniref:hypothetical protein n=1 Tax=Noviherbaspirillum malthae TaxID=1260987 RepID=UPI00188ED9AC|nr:hypothetical protein [Noviherbaspirillum malthae]
MKLGTSTLWLSTITSLAKRSTREQEPADDGHASFSPGLTPPSPQLPRQKKRPDKSAKSGKNLSRFFMRHKSSSRSASSPVAVQARETASSPASTSSTRADEFVLPEILDFGEPLPTNWDELTNMRPMTGSAEEHRVERDYAPLAASRVPPQSISNEGPQQDGEASLHGISVEKKKTADSSLKPLSVRDKGASETTASRPFPLDSGTPPAEQGAVITADGMYDRTQLHGFVDRFTDACTAVLDSIDGDNKQTQKQRQDLFSQLEAIKAIPPDEAEGNVITPNLAIRDHIAAAADMAYTLAGKSMLGTGQHPDANARRFYAAMASNLVQLKRTALSAAAPSLAKNWAARELARMENSVPTIDYMSRSMLADDAGLGISHDFGPAGVGAGASRNKTFWFDDDRDANYWNGYGGSLSATGPGSWLMGLQASISAEAGSVYFETDSMEEILRLVLNHDANHPANRLLMQSAAPRMREAITRLRSSRQTLERALLGRIHTEESDKPHYLSDNKISKGVNQTLLHLHAEALDGLSRSSQPSNANEVSGTQQPGVFSELVKQAFPSPSERIARNEGFPDFLGATIPDSDPLGYGKAPYRNYRIAATAGMSKFHGIATGASTGAGGAVTLSANTAQFHLRNVEPSNRLLDPDYHADMALTFKLVNQINAKRGNSPRMHLYRKVNEQFGVPSEDKLSLSNTDQHYYGPDADIPDCFRTAIAGPQNVEGAKQRINALEKYCAGLHQTYIDFMNSAAHIAAKPDHFTYKTVLPKLTQLRQEAFNDINSTVWGAVDGTPGYPPGMQAALKNPDAFIAASHDAIGLALGLAGIYLAIAKRRMTQLDTGLEPPQRNDCARAIHDADTAYMKMKMALNQTGLPMKRESVFLLDNTLEDRGTSQRHNVIAQVSGSGGLSLNIFESAAEQAGGSMEGYSISNAAGTVTGAIRLRLQHADSQINPSRQGQFIEFKITLTAGAPVIGEALVTALMTGLKRIYSKSSKADDWARQQASLVEQLQGTVWNVSAGAGVTGRLRRFPNAAVSDFRLQFMQVHDQKSGGASIGIPLPHPGGVTSLGLNRQHTLQNVVTEYMGADISYLMLQHKKLERVMKRAASIAAEHGADENEVLRAIFTGSADSGKPWHEAILVNHGGTWVAESYFGIGSMIPRLIDDYLDYLHSETPAGQTEQSGNNPDNSRFENEFHRYYDSSSQEEPFRRVAEIAREAKHHAPGSTFHARSGTGERADPFMVPPSLRTPVAAPHFPSGQDWNQVKDTITGWDTLQKRIDYYCSDQGRPVLDWFIRIVENTRAIHNLSRHRATKTEYGFETRIRNLGNDRRVLTKRDRPASSAGVDDGSGSQTA